MCACERDMCVGKYIHLCVKENGVGCVCDEEVKSSREKVRFYLWTTRREEWKEKRERVGRMRGQFRQGADVSSEVPIYG